MIKIKISNPIKGKNKISFMGFLMLKNLLRDYSIDITESDDYDYLFLGANDILNKKISLQESIDYGLENCNKITGDYFLFDGSDSTSLMGAYEVFEQSDAKFLFKNQLLKTREDYKKPTSFNKWFFKNGSDLDLGYDIPEETWKRIRLSGWNLGYLKGDYFRPTNQKWYEISKDKVFDLCAIFQANHPPNSDHLAENASFYTNHRKGAWEVIGDNPGYTYVKDKLPFQEYMNTLYRSKMSLSPFGMGELCYRDFEVFELGVAMIKPNMNIVNTTPNPYIPDETYIPVDLDWQDLNEVVLSMLDNQNQLDYIVNNSRKVYDNLYSAHTFCMYWYDFFSNLNNVKQETR
tara:strand:+ start:1487 stop:2527 length:1041 start_codon:yes stop_codon:yes gene_type:complete